MAQSIAAQAGRGGWVVQESRPPLPIAGSPCAAGGEVATNGDSHGAGRAAVDTIDAVYRNGWGNASTGVSISCGSWRTSKRTSPAPCGRSRSPSATTIAEGDTVVILESMKMEMPIEAEDDGTVAEILVEEGQAVQEGDILVVLS